jgi:hypothetical protein
LNAFSSGKVVSSSTRNCWSMSLKVVTEVICVPNVYV